MPYNVNHTNQLNHILVNERFANDITDVKIYRKADCDSNHFLVIMKFRVKQKTRCKNIRPGTIKYDVENLKDNRKCKEFKKNMQEMVREVHLDPEIIDNQWKEIKDILGKMSEKG